MNIILELLLHYYKLKECLIIHFKDLIRIYILNLNILIIFLKILKEILILLYVKKKLEWKKMLRLKK